MVCWVETNFPALLYPFLVWNLLSVWPLHFQCFPNLRPIQNFFSTQLLFSTGQPCPIYLPGAFMVASDSWSDNLKQALNSSEHTTVFTKYAYLIAVDFWSLFSLYLNESSLDTDPCRVFPGFTILQKDGIATSENHILLKWTQTYLKHLNMMVPYFALLARLSHSTEWQSSFQ